MSSNFMFEIAMAFLALLSVAGLFLAGFFIRRARFKEKITLVEKGIDIRELNVKENRSWLKIGIVLTGIAIGCVIASLILTGPSGEKFNNMTAFPIGVVGLTAGLSMILAYFVGGDKARK